jgi:hypothetical protein
VAAHYDGEERLGRDATSPTSRGEAAGAPARLGNGVTALCARVRREWERGRREPGSGKGERARRRGANEELGRLRRKRPGHVEARQELRPRMVSTSWPRVVHGSPTSSTWWASVRAKWSTNLGRLQAELGHGSKS